MLDEKFCCLESKLLNGIVEGGFVLNVSVNGKNKLFYCVNIVESFMDSCCVEKWNLLIKN